MVSEVIVPVIDQAGGELVLTKWQKHEGEAVHRGDALCEIETSKASVEIPADVDGVLRRILIVEGTSIPSLTVIALIADAAEPLPQVDPYYRVTGRSAKEGGGAGEERTPTGERPAINRRATKAAPVKTGFPDSTGQVDAPVGREIIASPRARRLAAEHGVDLAAIAGSGPNGRIVEEDVRMAIRHK
jgi:pyruvate dehydrogenase E2 component (dihydrolipoamide acetyltransferase)